MKLRKDYEEKIDYERKTRVPRGYEEFKNLKVKESKVRIQKSIERFLRGCSLDNLLNNILNYEYLKQFKAKKENELMELNKEIEENIEDDTIQSILKISLRKYLRDTFIILQVISASEEESEAIIKLLYLSNKKASNNIENFVRDYIRLERGDIKDLTEKGIKKLESMSILPTKLSREVLGLLENDEVVEGLEDAKNKLIFMLGMYKYTPLNYYKDSFKVYFALLLYGIYAGLKQKDSSGSQEVSFKKDKRVIRRILNQINDPAFLFFANIAKIGGAADYLTFLLNKMQKIKKETEKEKKKYVKLESILLGALRRITKELENKGVVPLNPSYLISAALNEFEYEIKNKPGVKKGTIEAVNEGKFINGNWLLKVLIENQIPVTPLILPPYKEDFPGKSRIFVLGTSRIMKGGIPEEARDIVKKLINRATRVIERIGSDRIIYKMLEYAPSATDGYNIYIDPIIAEANLPFINLCFLSSYLIHESNHINYGSFEFNIRHRDGKRSVIDSNKVIGELTKLDIIKERGDKVFFKFLNEGIERFNKKIIKKVDSSEKMAGLHFFKTFYDEMFELIKNNREYYDNSNIKKFYYIFANIGSDLFNIFEDRKIDHRYEAREEDRDLADAYKTVKHLLLYSSILSEKRYFKNKLLEGKKNYLSDESKREDLDKSIVGKVLLALYHTKLEDVFKRYYEIKGTKEIVNAYLTLLDNLERYLDEEAGDNAELSMNKSLEASLAYAAMIALFTERFNINREGGKEGETNSIKDPWGKSRQGGGQEKQQKEGQEEKQKEGQGEKQKEGQEKQQKEGQEEKQKEGQGEKQKEGQEKQQKEGQEKQHDEDSYEEGNKKSKYAADNEALKSAKVKARESKEDKKGGKTEGNVEENEGDYYKIMLDARDVIKYKKFFDRIKEGFLDILEFYDKKGEFDLRRIIDLFERGEQKIFKNSNFILKEKEQGYLYPKEINIYVAIDTSGSMNRQRLETSLKQVLAMFYAYKQTINGKPISNNIFVNLKLVSMSDSGIVGSWDARDFKYEVYGNSIIAKYKFYTQGGGTNLPGMLKGFMKVIKNQEDKVNESIVVKNKIKDYASYLILSFTDLGDNAGDTEGMKDAINDFKEFAEDYYRRSKSLRGKGRNAGVVLTFVSPEVDDSNIMKVVKDKLDNGFVDLSTKNNHSEAIVRLLIKNLPILLGDKAFNSRD